MDGSGLGSTSMRIHKRWFTASGGQGRLLQWTNLQYEESGLKLKAPGESEKRRMLRR